MKTHLKSGSSLVEFASQPSLSVTVRLDGKIIGTIKPDDSHRWRYYPKGGKIPGEAFDTLEECQNSLA